ncbi:MAG TPA: YtxH domain-containing protein [Virgibacillus sp.]|nr:YtxH domain-containing protein [Virgibacillus sp.]
MGKNKLLTSIIVGGVVGGLVALRDKETRSYTTAKFDSVKRKCRQLKNNPSMVVAQVRTSIDECNERLTEGVDRTINALEQVEDTVDKLVNK